MVDNHRLLVETNKLHHCPTYNYKDVYDVLRLLSEEVLAKHYIEIAAKLSQHGLFPVISGGKSFSFHVFKSLYFSFTGAAIKENLKNNLLAKDNYWMQIKI